jgi:hypothetical protein
MQNIRVGAVISKSFHHKQIHWTDIFQVYVIRQSILWPVVPFLGNDSVNTFPRQRIRRQQSDNFRYYATRCKCNNKGRGVSYVVHISICWATDVFSMGSPRDYISSTEQNQITRHLLSENEDRASPWQSRTKGSAEDWMWVIVIDCKRSCQ